MAPGDHQIDTLVPHARMFNRNMPIVHAGIMKIKILVKISKVSQVLVQNMRRKKNTALNLVNPKVQMAHASPAINACQVRTRTARYGKNCYYLSSCLFYSEHKRWIIRCLESRVMDGHRWFGSVKRRGMLSYWPTIDSHNI